jgi:hypothetical protein
MNKSQEQGADDAHAAAAFLELTREGSQTRQESGPEEEQQESADQELTYEPVPPHRSIPIQVTCRLEGRGQPLAFPEDDS